MSIKDTLSNFGSRVIRGTKVIASSGREAYQEIQTGPEEGEDTRAVLKRVRDEAARAAREKKEQLRQSELSSAREKGERAQEKWEAGQTQREVAQARLGSEAEARTTKAAIARARKTSRESSIIGSAVATVIKRSDRKADRRAKYSQPRTKKVTKEIVEVSGSNSNLYNMGGLRHLTAPRAPGTSSPNLSPLGDLARLRGMTLGSPNASRLSPNQSSVLSAMQSGITVNKEISNLTQMPIMQVARAKSGLKRKGFIRA
jgi:hypothetical protein